jgi:hypothetical protein
MVSGPRHSFQKIDLPQEEPQCFIRKTTVTSSTTSKTMIAASISGTNCCSLPGAGCGGLAGGG